MKAYIIFNLSLLFLVFCSCDTDKTPIENNNLFNLAPGFELGDSIYLKNFEAWLYLIHNSNESHATNYCLISFANAKDKVIIPTSKICINDLSVTNFTVSCDYNFKDFERYLNNNISKYENIQKYENDYQTIFDVYMSLYSNYPYDDSIASVIRSHVDTMTNHKFFVQEAVVDLLKYRYYHDLMLVYIPIDTNNFSTSRLNRSRFICIKHFSEN